MHSIHPARVPRTGRAFTLIELLLSTVILSILVLALTSVMGVAQRTWRDGQKRTEAFQSARTCLEIMARELTPAVVDTRSQMVVAPSSILTDVGARKIALNSPTLIWMAPLGPNGDLRAVGYYLYRDEERQFYRLKRLFITPEDKDGKVQPYFPKMVNLDNPADPALRTSPVNARWFTQQWNKEAFDEEDPLNDKVVVSAAADGVVAFWVRCIDVLGNPIPSLSLDRSHPASDLYFNSASYSQTAVSTPFENGKSFVYLTETPQSLKANRVPASVELTVVTLDSATLDTGVIPPHQTLIMDSNGTPDVAASVAAFEAELHARKIYSARTFTTQVRLTNGN